MAEVTAGFKPYYIGKDVKETTNFKIVVKNSVEPKPDISYKTFVPEGGILLGALKRLQFTTDFKFTYMEYQDYGPYLNSVNGLFEDRGKDIYWMLEAEIDGKEVLLPVGIGCYVPKENDEIILHYTKWQG